MTADTAAGKTVINEVNWKLRNQVTDFMNKFFRYGNLVDESTFKVSLSKVNAYKELFYENAKLYNDLEGGAELISTHQYFSYLVDYLLDKTYAILYDENITTSYLDQRLTTDLGRIKPEPDGSFKLKIPIKKMTFQRFDRKTRKLENIVTPEAISMIVTLYAHPENNETYILTIEKTKL